MLKSRVSGKSKRRRMGSEEGSDSAGCCNLSELSGIVMAENRSDFIYLEFKNITLLQLAELCGSQKGNNKVISS